MSGDCYILMQLQQQVAAALAPLPHDLELSWSRDLEQSRQDFVRLHGAFTIALIANVIRAHIAFCCLSDDF